MGLFDQLKSFESLEALNKHWSTCNRCVLRLKNGSVCSGIGDETCTIMVVGKSPTKQESMSGRGMMTDRGGLEIKAFFYDLSRAWGISPESIYYSNVTKCPSTVKDPNKEHYTIDEHGNRVGDPIVPAAQCSMYLEEEIAIIQPKLIISIGESALRYFAARNRNIPVSMDKARKHIWKYRNANFIACVMPIAINEENRIPILEDKSFLRKHAFGAQSIQATTNTPEIPKIEDVFSDAVRCRLCNLCDKSNIRVFGNGSLRSDVMFVGEAPGQRENETGAPFVGDAGLYMWSNVLRKLQIPKGSKLAGSNGILDLKRVYITNSVKCWPGRGNPNPTDEQIDSCGSYLRDQIRIVDPKIIVCLGRISAQAVTGVNQAINKMRGRIWNSPYSKARVIVTWHPSYAMRKEGEMPTNQPCLDMINDISKALELANENRPQIG